jgi:hypothetical protein
MLSRQGIWSVEIGPELDLYSVHGGTESQVRAYAEEARDNGRRKTIAVITRWHVSDGRLLERIVIGDDD